MANRISWTDETWNPTLGCERVSPGCDNCLAPETRVLRADMTWAQISDIRVGDRLVSFTDKPALGQNRVWEEATVEAVWETEKPTISVELANGAKFTASEDHLWLIAKRGATTWWRPTAGLNFKTEVRAFQCTPTDTGSPDYRAGYIAGATAGDGTFRWDPSWRSSSVGFPQSYWRVAKPERDRAVLERLVAYLRHFDAEVHIRKFDSGPSSSIKPPLPMLKVETRKREHLALITELVRERGSREWMVGWLAGMFDTDASYTGGSLRFCQSKPNDVLDRVERYGKELGFDLQAEHHAGCPTVRLMGGIAENLSFLSTISPVLTRRCRDFYGKRLETSASPVVGIRRGPAQRLIDITTSTGTFIAEGALTHNCYAITSAHMRASNPHPKIAAAFAGLTHRTEGRVDWTGQINLLPDRLTKPLGWKKPRRIFVNSMSDLFHAEVPNRFIADVFAVMAATPQHTYQVLSKRHGRMKSLLRDGTFRAAVEIYLADLLRVDEAPLSWPLSNVWLGVSVEDQKRADLRIPALLQTPAAVRFISAEPLLGPVDLRQVWFHCPVHDSADGMNFCVNECPHRRGLDWLISGGESGPGARPASPDWFRSLRDQCAAANVAYFHKQNGQKRDGRDLDGREWSEYPADTRTVR